MVLRRYDCVRRHVDRYSPPDFHSTFALSISNEDPRLVIEEIKSSKGKL